jgi:hypothetical protein
MLHEIGHVVDGVGLIQEMKAGTQWFRVRIEDPDNTFPPHQNSALSRRIRLVVPIE